MTWRRWATPACFARQTDEDVADAALNADSSDAVTGAQLYGTNQAVAQNTADIANISNGSTGLRGENKSDLARPDRRKGLAEPRAAMSTSRAPRGRVNCSAWPPGTTASSAINLGQFSPAVASLGGGATVSASGSVTGPTYRVQWHANHSGRRAQLARHGPDVAGNPDQWRHRRSGHAQSEYSDILVGAAAIRNPRRLHAARAAPACWTASR